MAFVVFLVVVVLHVAAANAEVSGEEVAKLQEGGKRDCVCMNWRNCHGSINSE